MSFLQGLRDAVFEADPNAPKAAPAPAPAVQGQTPGLTITASNISPGVPMAMAAPVDATFVGAIKKAVFGRNTALTQLMATADKLANIIPDPSQRLKAAFATAGDGRTVKQIADAVDVHLSDVDGEELKFKQVLDSKAQTEVAPLEQQHQAAMSQIQAAQNEIQAAQQRIADLNASIANLSTQASQAAQGAQAKKQELDTMAVSFKAAANAVRTELQQNKAVIMTALG